MLQLHRRIPELPAPDDHLLAKEVAAPAGPAVAQVKSTATCSVNDRESPWVTLLTGTWRAHAGLLAAPPDHTYVDTCQPFTAIRIGPRAGVIAARLPRSSRMARTVIRPRGSQSGCPEGTTGTAFLPRAEKVRQPVPVTKIPIACNV